MNRSGVLARLAKLEAQYRVDPIVLHFDGKPSVTIAGTARNFFRLINAAMRGESDPNVTALQHCTRIEGHARELFALAQSLIHGPALDDNAPTTKGDDEWNRTSKHGGQRRSQRATN